MGGMDVAMSERLPAFDYLVEGAARIKALRPRVIAPPTDPYAYRDTAILHSEMGYLAVGLHDDGSFAAAYGATAAVAQDNLCGRRQVGRCHIEVRGEDTDGTDHHVTA